MLASNVAYQAPEFGAGIMRKARPSGPLAIEAIEARDHWASMEEAVATVTVTNRSSETVAGIVWWHLADPGDPEPWKFAAATSHRLERVWEAGESKVVRLAVEGSVPDGNGYELSVWAHEGELGSSTQSDAVTYDGGIDIKNREDG